MMRYGMIGCGMMGQEHLKNIRLLPRNPAHAPIVVEPDQDFAIEGVYCGLVRQG